MTEEVPYVTVVNSCDWTSDSVLSRHSILCNLVCERFIKTCLLDYVDRNSIAMCLKTQ